MNEKKININLAELSYTIRIGKNGMGKWAKAFCETTKPSASCVIINKTIQAKLPKFIETVTTATGSDFRYDIPDGEKYKTLKTWEGILEYLLKTRFDRNMCLIALGGGVVGDIAGFAAASYLRGVRYVQVPTTLLAMVDSSIGGKTAVNHQLGKNMIGSFWQPAEVWIDIAALETLPEREFLAGMAEVIKYAFIGGKELFEWMEENIDRLLRRDEETLVECIFRCCEFKAYVVEHDERESGMRAILNYGHTFAHAIESAAGYGSILHGEAVTYGMRAAAELSRLLKKTDAEFCRRHNRLLAGLKTPELPALPIETLMDAMLHDKKVQKNSLRLIVATGYGAVDIMETIPRETILEAWKAIL